MTLPSDIFYAVFPILGPLLCLIYVNDIAKDSNIFYFADYTTMV